MQKYIKLKNNIFVCIFSNFKCKPETHEFTNTLDKYSYKIKLWK